MINQICNAKLNLKKAKIRNTTDLLCLYSKSLQNVSAQLLKFGLSDRIFLETLIKKKNLFSQIYVRKSEKLANTAIGECQPFMTYILSAALHETKAGTEICKVCTKLRIC